MKSEWSKNEDRTLSFIKMNLDLGKTEIEVPAVVFKIIKELMVSPKFNKVRSKITFKIINRPNNLTT